MVQYKVVRVSETNCRPKFRLDWKLGIPVNSTHYTTLILYRTCERWTQRALYLQQSTNTLRRPPTTKTCQQQTRPNRLPAHPRPTPVLTGDPCSMSSKNHPRPIKIVVLTIPKYTTVQAMAMSLMCTLTVPQERMIGLQSTLKAGQLTSETSSPISHVQLTIVYEMSGLICTTSAFGHESIRWNSQTLRKRRLRLKWRKGMSRLEKSICYRRETRNMGE